MSCLRLEEIHGYLEDELGSAERLSCENHLAVCGRCRRALEDRKILQEAVRGLDSLEVPPDFARRVMDGLFRRRRLSLPGWAAVFLAGAAGLPAAFLVFCISTGRSLPSLVLGANRALWSFAKSAALASAKLFKVFVFSSRLFLELVEDFLTGFYRLFSNVVEPELQVLGIVLAVLSAAALIFGFRRLTFSGGKP